MTQKNEYYFNSANVINIIMKIKDECKKVISNAAANIAIELEKTPQTVYRWLYRQPHLLKKRNTLKAIKKHTGLTEDEIFEKEVTK